MTLDEEHRDTVERKKDRVEGLNALLQTWEQSPTPDPEYILQLAKRYRTARDQFNVMKP